ncbi:VanZ family protein [Thalassotalea litorea]|uniref:VanZ family protein n=1 Tax=Thalassotalea litorea TaxID=2020715 RepID=UPI00373530A6
MSFSAVFATVAFVLACAISYLFWFDGVSELHRTHLLDKAAHFLVFFLLNGALYALCRIPQRVLLPGLICYAALTEIGQWLLGFRAAQWGDFYADVTGCLVFTMLYFLFVKLGQLNTNKVLTKLMAAKEDSQ